MHDMVDYEYYVNCYLGNLIPQKDFSALAGRAQAYLNRLYRAASVYLDIYRGKGCYGVSAV